MKQSENIKKSIKSLKKEQADINNNVQSYLNKCFNIEKDIKKINDLVNESQDSMYESVETENKNITEKIKRSKEDVESGRQEIIDIISKEIKKLEAELEAELKKEAQNVEDFKISGKKSTI